MTDIDKPCLNPMIVQSASFCSEYSIMKIRIITGSTILGCQEECFKEPDCVMFGIGKEGSYLNECHLMGSQKCTFNQDKKFDYFIFATEQSWSKKFDTITHDEYLFSTNDGSHWLSVSKSEIT